LFGQFAALSFRQFSSGGLMVQALNKSEHDGKRRIAVIGAGPAGLVTARTLVSSGADVSIFERGSAVGGTWLGADHNGRNFIYKNLHINTSKRLTAFEGYPFPKETQVVPDHRDMARYLQGYAEHFGLIDKVRFGCAVTEVAPAGHGTSGGWTVKADGRPEEVFDAVVVAIGPFNRPFHSPDLAAFQGTYVHSADYRDPVPYAGKKVCIVGAGNSAVDIGSDVCRTAERVVMVARSPVFVTPHLIRGVSFNDISRALQKPFVPSKLRRALLRGLVRIIHGKMTDCGFRPLTHKVHATISSTVVQDILFQRIDVKNGISKIDGRRITFADGESDEFDVLFAATGFITEFPFLAPSIIPTDGRLSLFNRIVPPGHDGLYFVGMINIDTPINFACEQQAKWVTAIEMGRTKLPSINEMHDAIARKDAWVRREYGSAARHSLQEESMIYYRELKRSLRDALNRAASSGGKPSSAAARNDRGTTLKNGSATAGRTDF
jgi:thioredoxin reductase